jgi:hypothetical protein
MPLQFLEKLRAIQQPFRTVQSLRKDPSEIGFRERVGTM